MRFWLLFITALFLAGCSSHRAPAPNARLTVSIAVIARLNGQIQLFVMEEWVVVAWIVLALY